jgi:hypothetical protein
LGNAVGHDSQDEEGGNEEDEDAKWTRLDAVEEAAATKKEARVWARAQAQHPFTDDDDDPNDHSSERDSSSSDASTASTSFQEVMSRKRLRENDETGPSKKNQLV